MCVYIYVCVGGGMYVYGFTTWFDLFSYNDYIYKLIEKTSLHFYNDCMIKI